MTYVTKTYLPSKEKLLTYIDQIYDNNWITNNGPLVQLLEKRLKEFLGVKNIILVSNGTTALEISYKILNIKKQVLTTPFSFVATTSSLVSNNIQPIYVDIDSSNFTINPNEIEKHITPDTEAIVPVHVFGNACDVIKIAKIAKKHNLKVIYDAAHAFSTKFNNESILNYGDLSILSFHATKLFHTIEGGAIITDDDQLADKIRSYINFGIKDETHITQIGINAKMNEFEAAMGLCVLDEFNLIITKREQIWMRYYNELSNILQLQKINQNSSNNFSYFPIIFNNTNQLLKIKAILNNYNIFPRRYFYPSLDTLSYVKPQQYMNISRSISERILCLPLYPDLPLKTQSLIIKLIKENI